MSRARAALIASDPSVEEVASLELAGGGSAVAAVVAGFFVAAGRSAGVLLSPVTLLVAGVGQSGRVFDGRWCQPGRGARRPRGLLPAQAVPEAARIAVPTSVIALAVAVAYEASGSLAPLVRHGIIAAERASSPERAALLTRIAGVGPAAFSEPSFVQPMLRIGSPGQGGLLSPADFTPPPDLDESATERLEGEVRWIEPPWAREPQAKSSELGLGHAIVAVDAHGRFAALSYRVLNAGIRLPELDVTAPLGAIPVQRGVPRVAPGRRISCPAPLAIVRGEASTAVEVLAEPDAQLLLVTANSGSRFSIKRDPRSRLVAPRRAT